MLIRKFNLKSLVSIFLICMICLVIFGVLFYSEGYPIVMIQTKSEAMRIAQSAALDIDGDVFDSIDSQESPAYKEVYDRLSGYKNSESIIFIYAMKKLEGKNIVFVVDTDENDPADFYEPYEWLESMAPAFNGMVCSDEDYTSDEWGTYLSGYAPIYDSQNNVVGIVGCDINIETINKRIATLRVLIAILGVIPNVILFLMMESGTKGGKLSI